MIKAIIFDCFGVIAVDGWLPFKQKYFEHDPELMRRAVELNKKCDSGQLDYDDYAKEIADMAGITPEQFKDAMENTAIDEKLMSFIAKELKPKYKIGMLSNVASTWLVDKFEPEEIDLFDALALSSQTGHAKPDPAAYQDVLDKLDVKPEQAFFTDDQVNYCTAAEALGIKTIVYKSFNQFKGELSKMLAEN